MRTKTLLLTAALSAAGIAAAEAQVYSVNAVGYVNLSITVDANLAFTYAIIANPLNAANNNDLNTVLPPANIPVGTSLYFFRNGNFESSIAAGESWIPSTAWNPGEAAFIEIPQGTASPLTLTFVGEVPQGTLVNPMPDGYSLRSSIVPQAGKVTAALGLNAGAGHQIYLFRNGTYDSKIALGDGNWLPDEPDIAVGEGFFYEILDGTAFNWSRNFSVNTP